MATATVKATYSLDPGTVCRLEEIARHWGVSKSEALRRAIRAAAVGPAAGPSEPLAALDALQRGAALTPATTRAWAAEARKERRASSSRAGKHSR
jgi:transposase-like protein